MGCSGFEGVSANDKADINVRFFYVQDSFR